MNLVIKKKTFSTRADRAGNIFPRPGPGPARQMTSMSAHKCFYTSLDLLACNKTKLTLSFLFFLGHHIRADVVHSNGGFLIR